MEDRLEVLLQKNVMKEGRDLALTRRPHTLADMLET